MTPKITWQTVIYLFLYEAFGNEYYLFLHFYFEYKYKSECMH